MNRVLLFGRVAVVVVRSMSAARRNPATDSCTAPSPYR